MKNILFTLLSIFTAFVGFSQSPTPTAKQSKSVLIKNATAHIGNGDTIAQALIGFEGGKITFLANALTSASVDDQFDVVIEAKGKHVYPGFIAPNSTLGLVEVDAVRATVDKYEVGKINPHIRTIIAYNTESKVTPTVRSNGVLTLQVTPRSGLISGSSSIVQVDGWNWEDAVLVEDDGLHIYWPEKMTYNWSGKKKGTYTLSKKYQKDIDLLKQFFANAKAYCSTSSVDEVDLRYEAMRSLFKGNQKLFIHAQSAWQITHAVQFSKQTQLKQLVIVGGYDSWMLTDLLKENNVSVMLHRTHSLPARKDDDVLLPYKLPYLLHQAGILYCLQNSGDMEAMNTRNLPFLAGTSVAYGLSKEEALSSITFNTAKILGIDQQLGTIEKGKNATLFISEGDALDMRTNQVTEAFIDGRKIDLDNHHKQLYRKFSKKYEQE